MDRTTAEAALEGHELVMCLEGPAPQAKELERQLLSNDIPVMMTRPPPKACCGGACGCGSKLQLLVKPDDVSRVQALVSREWLEAVKREGTLEAFVQLNTPPADGAEPTELRCPACGCAQPLVEGACSDCGLQLE